MRVLVGVLLVALALAGCLADESGGEGLTGLVSESTGAPTCPAGEVYDGVVGTLFTGVSTGTSDSFSVPAGCTELIVSVGSDSTYVGDSWLRIEAPTHGSTVLFDAAGVRAAQVGAFVGASDSGAHLEPESGTWRVVAGGSGHFAFHVTARLA